MTFNHGVEGSSPSALTNEINYLAEFLFTSELSCGQCAGKSIAAAPAFDHTATADVRAVGIARVFAARVEV